jgi:hypothetical protein
VVRVLRPGGTVVVVTPDRTVLGAIAAVDGVLAAGLRGARSLSRLVRGRPPLSTSEHDEPWEEFLSRHDLAALARDVGLTTTRHENICFYPGPEGGGTFAALLTLAGPRVMARVEPPLRRLFALAARARLLNQKQMLVATR